MVLAIIYAIYLGYVNLRIPESFPTAHMIEEIVVETQDQNFCYPNLLNGHTTVIIVNQTETMTTTLTPYGVTTVVTLTSYFTMNTVTTFAYQKVETTQTTTESGIITITCTA